MSRAPSTFKQSDITRAVKGAFAAGAQSVRIELDRDGKIVVIAGKTSAELKITDAPALAPDTPDDVKKLL